MNFNLLFAYLLKDDQSSGEVEVIGSDNLDSLEGKVYLLKVVLCQ